MMLKCRGIGNCTLLELKPQRNRIVASEWNVFHLFWGQSTPLWSSVNHFVKELLDWAIVILTGVHQVSSCPTFNLLMSFLHLYVSLTLLRRLAPYCMCTGTLRWYFWPAALHCKPSSVNKLWISRGGRHRFCFCLPYILYVDFEGDASSFSMLALFSSNLSFCYRLRLE